MTSYLIFPACIMRSSMDVRCERVGVVSADLEDPLNAGRWTAMRTSKISEMIRCTIDRKHNNAKLIKVLRKYRLPLCLTFIDLKKAFDSVETEEVIEALLPRPFLPSQYIRALQELCSGFLTKISPFYNDVVIVVERGDRQGDTISPKLFSATLEGAIRELKWKDV
ncbi:unnamed protein product [Heligmosomoides polygyrus]|uniref:Reverse transcriptase domain-containing protein n=1 Tax=Heligmosomoides polygyrus TaxID=6339 RepID=A0A183GRS7_HELPZ|nr:unnamed protein product [Heligmosomoides polygyrus]